MTSSASAAQIAIMGLDATSRALVGAQAGQTPILDWPYDLEKLLDAPLIPQVKIVLCGPPPKGITVNEVAQAIRMKYSDAMILYLTPDRSGFVSKEYIKNGFTDAFLVPLEGPTFSKIFLEELARWSAGKIKAYRSVKLVDVQPGQSMDFDTYIYLPTNGKHLRYSEKGDPISHERAQRLASHNVANLEIAAEDMKKFYQFTAEQLKKLGSSETIGATEKQERMQKAVRELISGLFQDNSSDISFEIGKTVVTDCQEIVQAYIMASSSGTENKWYEKMMALAKTDNTAYTHSADVATFSAMFSLALGIGVPDQIAMAGLLHDIGQSEVDGAILVKAEHERTPEEQAAFQKHPIASVALIQNRKMVVPEMVLKIVAQHHERFDGKGYPNALRGTKIRPEAQLVALADELCYLMATTPEKAGLSPGQAIQKIYDDIPSGEDGHKYDPEIVRKLYQVFKPAS